MRAAFLLLISMSITTLYAQASDLCKVETGPVYKAIQEFDGSIDTRNALLNKYHMKRQAVYSTCSAEDIRRFEAAYRKKMGKEEESAFESWSFFPKPRKILDLGEVDGNAPRIPATIPFRQ